MKKHKIRYILLSVVLLMGMEAGAQNVAGQARVMVTGTVYGGEVGGESLPNVSITVRDAKTKKKYNKIFGISDLDGNFSLAVPQNSELVFTYLGYENFTLPVKNKDIEKKHIYMEESSNKLAETVVIGSRIVNKADVTSAFTVIDTKDLAMAPVGNPMSLLQGRVTGLDIQMNNGMPGSSGTFTMRGVSDVSIVGSGDDLDLAKSMPLFVIDGIPQTDVEDFDANGLVSGSGMSPLSSIPVEDIDNIQILKDAAATSLYGSDGAYGVIIITTKRGNTEKPTVSYSGNFTVSTPPRLRDVAIGNAERYIRMNQILQNDTSRYHGYGQVMMHPSLADSLNPYWNNHTDWQGQFYKVTYNQSHNLSFSGGTPIFDYKINGNYYTEKGIVRSTEFNRYSLNSNMGWRPNDRFYMSVDVKVSFTTNNTGSGNAMSQNGVAKGSNASSLLPPPSLYTASTDALSVFEVDNQNYQSSYSTAVNLNYRLPWDIRWNSTVSYSFSSTEKEYFSPAMLSSTYVAVTENSSSTGSKIFLKSGLSKSVNIFNLIQLGLTAGFRYTSQKNSGNGIKYTGLPNDHILGPIGHGASSGTSNISNDANTFSIDFQPSFKFLGINSHLRKDMSSVIDDDKYIINPSLSPELSSVYGKKQKWVINPGLSGMWKIGKEPFMKKWSDKITGLDIRASWGRVTKYKASRYDVWGKYDLNDTYTYDGVQYIPIDYGTLPNRDLDPITTTTYNIGANLDLFKGRFSLDMNAYYRQVDNQLSDIELPNHAGFSKIKSTEVSVVNYGYELSVSGSPLPMQSRFRLRCGMNFTINRNRMAKLPNEARQIIESNANSVNRLGSNALAMYLYINKGVYATDEDVPVDPATGRRLRIGGNNTKDAYFKAGDPIWVDVNGDYVIDSKDKVVAGNSQPLMYGGFYFNLGYGNFSLHTNFSFTLRRDIINAVLADKFNTYTNPLISEDKLVESGALPPIDAYNFWTPNNRVNAKYPNPYDYTHAQVIDPFRSDQTLWMEDGSYLKVNTISMNYSLPKRWVSFLRVENVSLKASVNNVYTFTNYSGINPENVNGLGYDRSGGYPNSRQWTMGASIRF